MSFTNYTELKSTIADWLNRSDLTSQIPDFISLCEADVNDRLRTVETETKATSTLTAGSETLSLPSNFGGLRSQPTISSSPVRRLDYFTPSQLDTVWASSETGQPKVYTIEGQSMRIRPLADVDYTVTILYYLGVPSLASSNTNWLLTSHPNVYLYGALTHSGPFIGDDSRVSMWAMFYDESIEALINGDKKKKFGGPLQMRSDVMGA